MAVAPGNSVLVQQTTRVDFTLSPGETNQQINVSGEAPLVQSTTSDLGHVIESKQMQALPLNGRLFEQLMPSFPVQIVDEAGCGFRRCRRRKLHAYRWFLDLIAVLDESTVDDHNTEPLNAFISITPPLDSVDSFKVEQATRTRNTGLSEELSSIW